MTGADTKRHTASVLDLPPILYKYRAFDAAPLRANRLADILLKHALWCGSPLSFNDPFDCVPRIERDSTLAERLDWARGFVERNQIGATRAERRIAMREIAVKHLTPSPVGTFPERGEEQAWRQMLEEVGILSLTAKPDSLLMWGHYAGSHSGYCLRFDPKKEPFMLAHRVRYSDVRPTYRPYEPNRQHITERLLLQKASAWAYEEEWRVVRGGGVGSMHFPAEALTGVILGAAISPEDERAIVDLLAKRQETVELLRATLDTDSYVMSIRPA